MTFSGMHEKEDFSDPNKPGRIDESDLEWWAQALGGPWFRYSDGQIIYRDKYDAPWAE
jgi:hypothetical protein